MLLERAMPEPTAHPKHSRKWYLLLVLPYLGLCFPALYARSTPALWGFPFFYWYQFLWVPLTSLVIYLVYRRVK